MIWPLLLYGLVVCALLIAELREDYRAQYLFKPLAALGFILIALMCGALESVYGQWILAGLVACAIGDCLLLPRDKPKLFLMGMAAFGLAHIIYSFGFIAYGIDPNYEINGKSAGTLAFLIPVFVFAGMADILMRAEASMRGPVIGYTVIITVMCILAFLTLYKWAMLGALCFAVSDYFVGRDRFGKPNPKNAIAISPLYFGAQALFALSVQM